MINWLYHTCAGSRASFSVHSSSTVNFADRIILGKASTHSFAASGNSYFNARNGIHIGDQFLFAPGVVIASANHGLADRNSYSDHGPVEIGHNVWLGARSVVLPGVKIGDNATVAAGAVVTKDVEAGAVVAGVPARTVVEPSAPATDDDQSALRR